LPSSLRTRPLGRTAAQAADSYLNVPAVISAAEIANVDAIHPGYGLLSENATSLRSAAPPISSSSDAPPEVTRLMGEKEKARQAMKNANVPILSRPSTALSSLPMRLWRGPKKLATLSFSKPRPRGGRARYAHRALA